MLKDLAYVGFYGYGYYSGQEAYAGIVCPKHMVEELFELLEDEYYIGEIDGKHSETECDPITHTDLDAVVGAIHLTIGNLGELDMFKSDERLDPYVEELKELNHKVSKYKITPITKYAVYDGDEKIL